MHIVFLNGNEFKGSWQDFMRALRHPLFAAFILCMTGLIFLIGPYDHILPKDVMARFLIVASSVGIYIATVVLWIAQSKRWAFMAFSFPVLLVAVMITSLWGVNMSVVAGGQAIDSTQWMILIAFNIAFCGLGELVLASFLLEPIAAGIGTKGHLTMAYSAPEPDEMPAPAVAPIPVTAVAKPTPVATAEPPKWAEILGEKLAIGEISHMKAEEHYVAVCLRCGRCVLLRGRLQDAIDTIPRDVGMQVHRSHWVARAALTKIWRARAGWRVQLHSGTEVPIARNRTASARDWAKTSLQRV
jgi:hypothetical protein